MDITKNTQIEYTIKDIKGEIVKCTFKLEQVEGSSPDFYEQLKKSLKDLDEFDIEHSEIVNRKIIL